MRCLVLAHTAEEWIGVDIASGAFVRVPGSPGDPIDDEELSAGVVEFAIGQTSVPLDPSRPELVTASAAPVLVGYPKARAVRRFLTRLATPESDGATVLGTRGPSIAFVDLDGNTGSVQLLTIPTKKLELGVNERDEPVCAIPWGGTTQRIRIVDPDAAHAAMASAPRPLRGVQITAALGFRPNFVLVGLGQVSGGHAPKVVLALL